MIGESPPFCRLNSQEGAAKDDIGKDAGSPSRALARDAGVNGRKGRDGLSRAFDPMVSAGSQPSGNGDAV